MPIYEYLCKDCDQKFEKLLLRKEDPVRCPRCGGSRYTLQFSVFGFEVHNANGVSFRPSLGGSCACGSGRCACHG